MTVSGNKTRLDLKKIQTKRLKTVFGSQNFESEINEKSDEIMSLISSSEQKLKEIQQTPAKTKIDETIKGNVEIIIGQKL